MEKLRKKAQVRMFETVAVIAVFFVILAFGFVFYASIKGSSDRQELAEAKNAKAIKIANIAQTLPELQCSRVQPIENCLDKLKMDSFAQYISGAQVKSRYYDLLKDSTIRVEQIYPREPAYSKVIYDRPKNSGKQSVWMPIAILDPVEGRTSFGILVVDVYE